MSEPLVSVIIPTYNRSAYLKEALESAVKQTYKNIEIIVSDNCSSENPQALVESFQDPRIRFYRNSTNIGLFANAIEAFKKARGKYAASLNDDDKWQPDFLEKLVPQLEANPELTIAFSDHYTIDENGVIDEQDTEKTTREWKRHLLKEGIYQPFWKLALIDCAVPVNAAALIRWEAVDWDNFPAQADHKWDIYIAYFCCRLGQGAYYNPNRLTCYRKHLQSDTSMGGRRDVQAKIRKAKVEIFCWERFMKDENLREIYPQLRQKWAEENTTLGIGLMRTGQTTAARPYFWRALKQQKFNLRTMTALTLSFTPSSLASRF